MRFCIEEEEILRRQASIKEEIQKKDREVFLSFSPVTTFYLTGFHFIPTERPTALIIAGAGGSFLFVPRLEEEHARSALVDEIVTYPEYPGREHPMEHLALALQERGLSKKKFLAESEGYGSAMGYRGAPLGEIIPDLELQVDPEPVEKMRMVKSPAEIELIKESACWGNLAHYLLQEYCAPGKTENEVAMRASQEATLTMMKTLGPLYTPQGQAGAQAGFRGQIGENSALPHAVNINAVMEKGHNLVTGAAAGVGGYTSELERTMFLGNPSPQQRTYFGYMLEMMEAAFNAIRPGRPCAEVDQAVHEIYEKYEIWETWRHHTGHALGILGHEAPFFDIGDFTIMEPGMVFSVEPGIYLPGIGGFRHSDTVLVTEKGMELITYYPRDLKDLIIPA